MTVWKSVNKIGIAIWNYSPGPKEHYRLSVLIGELVHIHQECEDWYYGYSLFSDLDQLGIFPKNFIFAQEYETQVTNIFNEAYFKFTFEQEALFALREWVKVCKQIYINDDQNRFNSVRNFLIETFACYQKLKSGKFTSDELKNIKNELAEKIDIGNKLLNLDLVVRNSDGLTINPLETNIIEYYRQHKNSLTHKYSSIQNEFSFGSGSKRNSTFRNSNSSATFPLSLNNIDLMSTAYKNNCYSITVTLNNFICTIRQDMDILMSLYDVKENKFISENYLVKWDKYGLMHDIDKLNNIRVVFTDLSINDLSKKLFLVCQVIRIGPMNIENQKNQHKKTVTSNPKKSYDELKRPCGIAVFDLMDPITKPLEYNESREIFLPFIPYYEKDSLDSLIRKFTKDSKDQNKDSPKSQGFRISIKIVLNSKMHTLEQSSSYYTQYQSYVARKIGFPDIILPEDVRNDLYLTLVSGEFHKGSKKSERNIEVTVRVFNEDGRLMEDCLSVGADNVMQSIYRSVVYYHEDRPKWMETIKISLSIEDFRSSHVKFTFKHRSSNENKDKNEKPFALSYIRLMNENGTTLKNDFFDIFVYKIDGKKFNDKDMSYLSLPSSRRELEEKFHIDGSDQSQMKHQLSKKFPSSLYAFNPKDLFSISIVVCSTKLAQNINIFGLLNWKEKKDSLEEILKNIQKLDGGEVVKFLHDALDALFEIWMDCGNTTAHDNLVFCGLVYIIRLLLQEKYMHFQDILNDYIEKNFSATLIFSKLIESFKYYIENPYLDFSYNTITTMEYIFKFIVRSRILFAIINNDEGKDSFEESLEELLSLFTNLMKISDEKLVKVKSGILKYFPLIISNLIVVFDERKLTNIVVELLCNIPVDQLCPQKLACLHDIIYTELFTNYSECRRKLLPVITVHLQANLCVENPYVPTESPNDKLQKCLLVISDILIIISKQELRAIKYDVSDMVSTLLQTMLETFQTIYQRYRTEDKKDNSLLQCHLWSIIITLLNQMTDYHYQDYFNRFKNINDLKFVLVNILQIFSDSTMLIFPPEWHDMNIVQNIVILKTMNHIVAYMKERIDFKKNNISLWNEIFMTAIRFITQKSLELENFTKLKRKRILSLYQDMRLEMVILIRSLWYSIGNYKKEFIPAIIGPLLEVATIPVLKIRRYTVIIFFDMFYCCFDQVNLIRNEVITQLDLLITSGKGDREFQILFEQTFLNSCENHPQEFKYSCLQFVKDVSEQIEKLLLYRDVVKNDDNYESLMSCIIELLDFYDRIDRREMYIRYLYKLYDLHVKCQNFSEAAYTLSKHCMLLEWSDRPLESLLRNDKYKDSNSHRELKEKLYYEIIENFNSGQMWEAGIAYCKDLIEQYENVFFDYVQLSLLFTKMSSFYNLILSSVRVEPEYFHVTYYGNGFPIFFRGKSFIYRGKGYERLFEFTKRLQSQFPNAKLLEKLDTPTEDLVNSNDQYLSIFKVDPIMNENVKNKFNGKLVDEKIINYYQFNEISDFTFSRKILKHDGSNAANEFACMWIERSEFKTGFALPGILFRSETIQKNTYLLNPLQNAIDTMEKVNEKTRSIIYKYLSDHDNSFPLHILMMHINGIVNSDVQGGISKYEEAFFETGSTVNAYEEKDLAKLKQLIADQIPLLDLAIKVVDEKQKSLKNQASMEGLYKHMFESFQKMRDDIERKYGSSELPVDLMKIIENHYKIQNLANNLSNSEINKRTEDNRNSMECSDGSFRTLTKSRSIFGRANGSTTNIANTLRFRKKESRRNNSESSNSIYASNANISKSQWYTDNQKSMSNISNISDSLGELSFNSVERKLSISRPNSGHYNSRASIQSQLQLFYRHNSSASSLSTTPPNSKENNNNNNNNYTENETPPPLPAKQSVVDSNVSTKMKLTNEKRKLSMDSNGIPIYESFITKN